MYARYADQVAYFPDAYRVRGSQPLACNQGLCLRCGMLEQLELGRWWKAVKAFGLGQGTSAYLFLALPRLSRFAERKAKPMRIPSVPHPIWLRPATTDWYVMEQIFIDQGFSLSRWPEHERAIRSNYERMLERGQTPVILDCGAHIGLAALWFAQQFLHARIFAVEPAQDNFELLRQNVSSHPNITPIHAAIWDRDTRVDLVNPDGEPWAWAARESGSGEVQTVTVRDLLQREPNGLPLIVKIDIEGGEIELFRSNVEWIEQTPLIVFELHDWQGGWRGAGHSVFSRLSTHPRDYMQRADNMFSFAHSLAQMN
jgi:FkbM family methyltransferase